MVHRPGQLAPQAFHPVLVDAFFRFSRCGFDFSCSLGSLSPFGHSPPCPGPFVLGSFLLSKSSGWGSGCVAVFHVGAVHCRPAIWQRAALFGTAAGSHSTPAQAFNQAKSRRCLFNCFHMSSLLSHPITGGVFMTRATSAATVTSIYEH